MNTETRTCAILFADIVKSSAIKGDALKTHVASLIKTLADQARTVEGILHVNTWGDGLVIVGNTPSTIADEALRIRDKFRYVDWENEGFSKPIQVRIGLDMNSVVLTFDNFNIVNVSGAGMDVASRVEPIVDANCVWCTLAFNHILAVQDISNIKITSVGVRQLAKGAGDSELFDISRSSDLAIQSLSDQQQKPSSTKPRMPRIRGRITDKDRDTFLRDAFVTIRAFFETAANELGISVPEADATIQPVHAMKFICTAYLNGASKNKFKIWLSQGSYQEGIFYSHDDYGFDDDNSYNGMIRIDDDDYELFLRPGMQIYSDESDKRLNAEGAAEYLWEVFIDRLER